MYLYSINIDLCTSNYHIQVIDVRSYKKDPYYTTSHSQATLFVGVHLVTPTAIPKPPTYDRYILVPIIGRESMLIGSIIDVFIHSQLVWAFSEISPKAQFLQ